MKNIDWDKAPSGATHYNTSCIYPWLKESPPSYFDSGVWVEYNSDCAYREYHFDKAVKRPQEMKNEETENKVKTAMFADIKVGDKVWDICEGWGVVSELLEGHDYPICVEFEYVDSTYTRDGYYDLKHVNPSLFWDEIKIEAPPKPLPDLLVDAKVFVWNNPESRLCRHFSHFDEDGALHVFIAGETSFSSCGLTNPWSCWELAE